MKTEQFRKVSSHVVLGRRVSVWRSIGRALDGYAFTATLDSNGRPARPGRKAHFSFDARWACHYLRRQLKTR